MTTRDDSMSSCVDGVASEAPRVRSLTAPVDLDVAVIVPTRNEAANVAALLDRLGPALASLNGSVLFVDDSSDETPSVIMRCARSSTLPVWVLHRPAAARVGGLGGAVQAGMSAVRADWIVVMDGDLQHPPEVIPEIFEMAAHGDADVVVASRFRAGGSAGGLSSPWRGLASAGAAAAAKALFPRAVGPVTDPMSGFFAVRRAAFDPAALRPHGFKILLELLCRNPQLRVREVPFAFAERSHGHSKASTREVSRYLLQLAALRLSPTSRVGRLARFGLVGASGVAVNLLALSLLLSLHVTRVHANGAALAATAATQVAIAWNFLLTERWVFPGRDGHWLSRIVPFWALSCLTLLAQLPLAAWLRPELRGSYVLATAAALAVLMLARFAVCDVVLYRLSGSGALSRVSFRVRAFGWSSGRRRDAQR